MGGIGVLVVLGSIPSVLLALPRYSIRDLGDFTPYDINNAGQVVGTTYQADGLERAVLYENGVITDLGAPAGAYSYAYQINSSGQIIGNYYINNTNYGFVYSQGQMTILPSLPGRDTYPNAINDRGDIVGVAEDSTGDSHPFLYRDGVMVDLAQELGDGSIAQSINNAGDIVGTHGTQAFYDAAGEVTFMSLPAKVGFPVQIGGINDAGQIALSAYQDVYIYDHGQLADAGLLAGPIGPLEMLPFDINHEGEIVGVGNQGRGVDWPFLYKDGDLFFLDSLLISADGWSLTRYKSTVSWNIAINDSGEIVGQGIEDGVGYRAYLLTPVVPESGVLAGVASIVVALVGGRQRRE